jgi:hypothetical protein
MTYFAVLNQKLYPGAGDVDDCWVVATCWAARIAGVRDLPTVTEFRAAANKPDKPGATGGSLTDIMRAVGVLWPDLGVVKYQSTNWDAFALALRRGKVASLGVLSSLLPAGLRFGFGGAHQVGVLFEGGYLVANPLAPQGSEPIPISETALRASARGLAQGWILAALFPRGGDTMAVALNGTDRKFASTHARDLKVGTQFWRTTTETLTRAPRDLVVDDYGYPVDTPGWAAVGASSAGYDADSEGENGIALVKTADAGVGPVRRKTLAELAAAANRFADVDAAYNAGRDAVVFVATSVPRR